MRRACVAATIEIIVTFKDMEVRRAVSRNVNAQRNVTAQVLALVMERAFSAALVARRSAHSWPIPVIVPSVFQTEFAI
jgi:hypothetical protein